MLTILLVIVLILLLAPWWTSVSDAAAFSARATRTQGFLD
jgi:hypothetical protein